MVPAPAFEELTKMLNSDRTIWNDSGPLSVFSDNVKIIGFVFFGQDFEKEPARGVLKNIDLLNEHSGEHIHFLLAGFSRFGPNSDERNAPKVCDLEGVPIYFNPRAFNTFREEFTRRIDGWDFDYGMDLILLNVRREKPVRVLDFGGAIYFKLDEMVKIGVCDNASQILGKITNFMEDNKIDDVDQIRKLFEDGFGRNWIKALILDLFPASIGKLARAKAVLGGGRALPGGTTTSN